VAVVDAYNDPTAETDLGVYRAQYGLADCTTTNGCFTKVNQTGATTPLPAGWAGEISVDLDMVSAICPNCDILLVEARSASNANLYAAEKKAVALGAKFISNSWGNPEYSDETADDSVFDHPGVAITASAGDYGDSASFPATSNYVTAVGGTTLTTSSNARGWAESAWTSSGSGCSAYQPKSAWQSATTSCTGRAESDVAADADPNTGVAVYQTTTMYDKLTVKVGTDTLATYSNLNKGSSYVLQTLPLGSYAGQTVTLTFTGVEDSSVQTSFLLDDTAITPN
jgi:subtilase family serine protease